MAVSLGGGALRGVRPAGLRGHVRPAAQPPRPPRPPMHTRAEVLSSPAAAWDRRLRSPSSGVLAREQFWAGMEKWKAG